MEDVNFGFGTYSQATDDELEELALPTRACRADRAAIVAASAARELTTRLAADLVGHLLGSNAWEVTAPATGWRGLIERVNFPTIIDDAILGAISIYEPQDDPEILIREIVVSALRADNAKELVLRQASTALDVVAFRQSKPRVRRTRTRSERA